MEEFYVCFFKRKWRKKKREQEKSSQGEEFGFNLHAEKGRGHFIGTVDQGGIGDRAGLRMGQRIVGVNGMLVYPNTPHKEVVAQIKRSPLRTTLLVASEDVDRWYKEHGAEFSFDYVEEETPIHHQQLSPHSIQISDDEEFQQHRHKAQPQSDKDEEHMEHIETEEVHEVAQDKVSVHREDSEVVQHKPESATGVETVVTVEDQGDLLEAVFSALPSLTPVETYVVSAEPELLSKTVELPLQQITKPRPPSRTNSTHSSHESAVDVQPHYVPTYQPNRQNPPQVSPPSNGSSLNGYPTSTTNSELSTTEEIE
ncbi:PDZ/DHR/GLGF domain protein [Teladorsagia circumcincta]|uniref:PDZ/DHR/GLGF domain protein n=1 Tax=Teladorsagia circumcincta TaxID=45464 RepID=A0A2G9U3C5_TELCI|nr:PDZ/DHR/GLGF domain protein [Teladorsagia circumcincta]